MPMLMLIRVTHSAHVQLSRIIVAHPACTHQRKLSIVSVSFCPPFLSTLPSCSSQPPPPLPPLARQQPASSPHSSNTQFTPPASPSPSLISSRLPSSRLPVMTALAHPSSPPSLAPLTRRSSSGMPQRPTSSQGRLPAWLTAWQTACRRGLAQVVQEAG